MAGVTRLRFYAGRGRDPSARHLQDQPLKAPIGTPIGELAHAWRGRGDLARACSESYRTSTKRTSIALLP